MVNEVDGQYLRLLKHILDDGEKREDDRTGMGTIGVFGPQLRFDLNDGFPILTTKRVGIKTTAKELFWFLSGDNSIRPLLIGEPRVTIWTSDAFRHNLDNIIGTDVLRNTEILDESIMDARLGDTKRIREILNAYEEKIIEDEDFADRCGKLGPNYGPQWRGKNGAIAADQIAKLEEALKEGGKSRRMLLSAWNSAQMDEMGLPPCHYSFQLHVSPETNRLSLLWNQRSVDTILGLPFNITSYALLTHMFAHTFGYKPGTLTGNLGDTHIYLPHIPAAEEQTQREPKTLPFIRFNQRRSSVLDYTLDDFELVGYTPHKKLNNPTPMFGGIF
jgi:thymidylate synthase